MVFSLGPFPSFSIALKYWHAMRSGMSNFYRCHMNRDWKFANVHLYASAEFDSICKSNHDVILVFPSSWIMFWYTNWFSWSNILPLIKNSTHIVVKQKHSCKLCYDEVNTIMLVHCSWIGISQCRSFDISLVTCTMLMHMPVM